MSILVRIFAPPDKAQKACQQAGKIQCIVALAQGLTITSRAVFQEFYLLRSTCRDRMIGGSCGFTTSSSSLKGAVRSPTAAGRPGSLPDSLAQPRRSLRSLGVALWGADHRSRAAADLTASPSENSEPL